MLTDPRISACIVLYHSGAEVTRAVESVLASTAPVDLFVVDNSPEDPVGKEIRHRWPQVQVIDMEKNVGFGQAHNAVLPLLKSTYHVLVNPDITFEPDLLARMAAYMDDHPDIQLLTPRVMNADGTEQFLPKRRPTIRYLLGGPLERRGLALMPQLEALKKEEEDADRLAREAWYAMERRGKRTAGGSVTANKREHRHSSLRRRRRRLERRIDRLTRWRREYTMQDAPPAEPTEVQFATGCFMFFRTHTFFRLKGFDKRYFLYHEDSDITLTAMRLGPVVYHPDFCVTHDWHRGSSHDWKLTWKHIVSTVKFFHKWGWKW